MEEIGTVLEVVPAFVGFDYISLDAETRVVVQQKAGEIRERSKIAGDALIAIGERLLEVKARLGHGQFGQWLAAEFGWSQDTAGNLMNVARLAGQNPKFSEVAALFDRSAATLLAAPSTPLAAQQELIERAATGERITHREAKGAVQHHKHVSEEPAPGAVHPLIAEAMDEPVPSPMPVPPPRQPVPWPDEYREQWILEHGPIKGQIRAHHRQSGQVTNHYLESDVDRMVEEMRGIERSLGENVSSTPDVAPVARPLPYGAAGQGRHIPIVSTVLYFDDQRHYYRLPEPQRLKPIYGTPTTVRLEAPGAKVGTLHKQTVVQTHVWCIRDDAAWQRLTTVHAVLQQALNAFANELRRLGRYDQRLAEAGGAKQHAELLSPTVISVSDPDLPDNSFVWLGKVPGIERKPAKRHTAKMIEVTYSWGDSLSGQQQFFVCPSDADWERVEAARQACDDAKAAFDVVLSELGHYDVALKDGRYLKAVEPPKPEPNPALAKLGDVFDQAVAGLRDVAGELVAELAAADLQVDTLAICDAGLVFGAMQKQVAGIPHQLPDSLATYFTKDDFDDWSEPLIAIMTHVMALCRAFEDEQQRLGLQAREVGA